MNPLETAIIVCNGELESERHLLEAAKSIQAGSCINYHLGRICSLQDALVRLETIKLWVMEQHQQLLEGVVRIAE